VQLDKALQRRRAHDLIAAALEQWKPVATETAIEQMIELDVTVSQIMHALRRERAEILNFAEDPVDARLSFTAKLMSAGEEFFVSVAVERVVPFVGSHVVIKGVWR